MTKLLLQPTHTVVIGLLDSQHAESSAAALMTGHEGGTAAYGVGNEAQ